MARDLGHIDRGINETGGFSSELPVCCLVSKRTLKRMYFFFAVKTGRDFSFSTCIPVHHKTRPMTRIVRQDLTNIQFDTGGMLLGFHFEKLLFRANYQFFLYRFFLQSQQQTFSLAQCAFCFDLIKRHHRLDFSAPCCRPETRINTMLLGFPLRRIKITSGHILSHSYRSFRSFHLRRIIPPRP